jgi:hypothetical protein
MACIPYLRGFSLIKPGKLPNFRLNEDKKSKLRNESNKLKTEIKVVTYDSHAFVVTQRIFFINFMLSYSQKITSKM